MYLHSLASAFPPDSYSQAECLDVLRNSGSWGVLRERSLAMLDKVFLGEGGISKRHLAVANFGAPSTSDAESLNRSFEQHAPKLAGDALKRALDEAGMKPGELDALFICTCTGYLCPGVSSHVAEQLGMRRDAVLHDVVGLGCGAAIPTLRSASQFLAAHPEMRAAVVAVEICSAAYFVSDDPGVLISLSLFGDAASASIWGGAPGKYALGLRGFRSLHIPEDREKIRFVNSGGKLCNKLHRSVPELAAKAVGTLFDEDRAATGSTPKDVISHTGGRDVIEALRGVLPEYSFADATSVLNDCGNVSSPCVMLALERYLQRQNGSGLDGELFLTAFGAGFSAHSCRAVPA